MWSRFDPGCMLAMIFDTYIYFFVFVFEGVFECPYWAGAELLFFTPTPEAFFQKLANSVTFE